jgi:hypothetical protein
MNRAAETLHIARYVLMASCESISVAYLHREDRSVQSHSF